MNFNAHVLHTKIITLRDNVKTYNGKLSQQTSILDEYYTTTYNQIWKDYEHLVESLKHRIEQLTSSLKLSTEAVRKIFEKRIEENSICENKLDILASKLTELLSDYPANDEKESTSYQDVEWECKALEKKCVMNQKDSLNVVRVKYEPQFVDLYHKIRTMTIGNIYLTENTECVQLSLENLNRNMCKAEHMSNSPPKLIAQSQCVIDEIDWISGITVTEQDHIFLCDRWGMAVKEYNPDGKLLKSFEMPDEPWDIGLISRTTIFVMLARDFKLALLEKSCDSDSFQLSKILETDKRYVSVCRVGSQIMATDRHTNIDILSPEGTLLHSLSIPALGEGMYWYPHRISPGISANTFLLLNWDIKNLLCYSMEETLEFSHDLKWGGVDDDASAVNIDKHGHIYVCDKRMLYTLSPKGIVNVLLTFEECLCEDPRMFICDSRDLLYLSCYENDNNYLKIFKIC